MKRFLVFLIFAVSLLAFGGCGEARLDDVAGKWAYEGNENWVWTFGKDFSFSERHEFEYGNGEIAVMSRDGTFQISSGSLVVTASGVAGESTVRFEVVFNGDTMTLTDSGGRSTELVKIE